MLQLTWSSKDFRMKETFFSIYNANLFTLQNFQNMEQ